MQNIWSRPNESRLSADETREAIQLHLTRHIGEPHVAFSDQDGWAGKSKEPGPPVDVMVVSPEGERRFAYVSTFGSSLKKGGDPLAYGGRKRMEFVLAAPQKGDAKADLAMLNLAANTVRQFAKLVHLQDVRVQAGETVQFSHRPKPMFPGSRQIAFAFLKPRLPADGFEIMRLSANRGGEGQVEFWGLAPIYRAELESSSTRGPAFLEKTLKTAGVTEMLDMDRKPAVGRGPLSWIGDFLARR